MRDYCRLTTCRRRYIMEYFGFEMEEVTPLHMCCDNCSKDCKCIECKGHDKETQDACEKQECDPVCTSYAKSMLEFYFLSENDVTQAPIPEAQTGLSQQFADELARCADVYCDASMLKIKFPYVNERYHSNIAVILSKALEVSKSEAGIRKESEAAGEKKKTSKRRGRKKSKPQITAI